MSLDVYLYGVPREPIYLFDANITHNLNAMAKAAGIYEACWRPEEIGVKRAGDLVPILERGLAWLRDNPDEARTHNSPNGWGTYDHFVPWVERYLEACRANPDAEIRVSR